jgi:hypothetical protein
MSRSCLVPMNFATTLFTNLSMSIEFQVVHLFRKGGFGAAP